ncbi:hypothetical protein L1987_70200 [Smallanthus sonchifolius]|uniref:Uncharacterized protein n=1 Tax=Smallanthus sonchifolius TaxID=185202 RepID=A0ACB9APH6_9ASTR|nr:hypothetical protein L1987_70200 [Smallanthus sonchifolius]
MDYISSNYSSLVSELLDRRYIATDYYNLVSKLGDKSYNVSDIKSSLMVYVMAIYKIDVGNRYSEPMVFIGMYITLASLCCILAMVADLLHGLRTRKLWFPCKYFGINAASLTVIAIAMKLPVDLSGDMPGVVDQVAKLGSMAFMCTMMANLLPCLATMDSKALLENIIALGVLVITLVVNICIQIHTGVVESYVEETSKLLQSISTGYYTSYDLLVLNKVTCSTIATIYVIMLLVLLIIHVCSALAILKSKEIIEEKYQHGHETASKYLKKSAKKFLFVDELQRYVSNHWIMAGSGNPQFIIACSATAIASGVICAFTTILHILTMGWTISDIEDGDYGSSYAWSMPLILIVQFTGIVLGTVAPLFRCFASLSFKVSFKSIFGHIKVFKVESYWTQKLSDWKHDSIRFPFRSRKRNVVLKNFKSLILNFAIKLQEAVVVLCKIITLIPFFFMICVFYCFWSLHWLLQAVFGFSGESTENLERSQYVLHLENEMELAERTLKGLSKSMNRLLQKGEKKQPNDLINILKEKSTIDFQGVKKIYNNDHRDCWSLAVVTFTTIAITLRKTKKEEVDILLKSVREGLEYVTLVEKHFNATNDYISNQKAAERLWQEVDVCHKWLGIKLKHITSDVNWEEDATMQIVQMFSKEAESKIKEGVGSTDGEGPNGDSEFTSICANSMSSITKTIIDDHKESHWKSFDDLISSRIADIMAACLTNLPQVIEMKCHTNVIEKREACVQAAARLLGETKQIINSLKDRDLPSMNSDDLPFLDKWCSYLCDP